MSKASKLGVSLKYNILILIFKINKKVEIRVPVLNDISAHIIAPASCPTAEYVVVAAAEHVKDQPERVMGPLQFTGCMSCLQFEAALSFKETHPDVLVLELEPEYLLITGPGAGSSLMTLSQPPCINCPLTGRN